jgi:hypothetical protein
MTALSHTDIGLVILVAMAVATAAMFALSVVLGVVA